MALEILSPIFPGLFVYFSNTPIAKRCRFLLSLDSPPLFFPLLSTKNPDVAPSSSSMSLPFSLWNLRHASNMSSVLPIPGVAISFSSYDRATSYSQLISHPPKSVV